MASDEACLASPDTCEPSGTILPSLLLIGTRKGGTTALSTLLREHPSIIMPNCTREQQKSAVGVSGMCWWDKEVRYFSRGLKRFGACWYRGLYSCPRTSVEDASSRFVAFDGSPDYFVLDGAAVARMSAQLGRDRTRLVALLRNPSDRFYSAYNMGMNEHLGRQPKKLAVASSKGGFGATYERFASELDRLLACAPDCPDEPRVVRMFFNYGLYAKHLSTYIAVFGKANLLVERSEDLYADAWPVVQRILAFGGLGEPGAFREHVQRQSRRGLSERAQNAGSVWGGSGYMGKLKDTERTKLSRFYAPHNRELYALVGRDFGWERDDAARARAAEANSAPEARRTGPPLRPEL